MRIVILEKSHVEADWLRKELQRIFPTFTITVFLHFGNFLNAFESLASETRLIIMEDRLALLEVEPNLMQTKADLEKRFPDLITNWKATDAPTAVLKLLRLKKIPIPIILHTHSFRDWADPNLMQDTLVTFTEKESGLKTNSLVGHMLRLLSIPT